MMFGLACFGLSMWSFSFITHDWGAAELLVPQLLRGFPQVFAVAPSVNLGLGSLPPERLKYASGLFNMMRNLGGAVGIAVSAAIINDRTNLHFQCIAAHLTPANGAMDRLCRPRRALRRAARRRGGWDTRRRCESFGTWRIARPRRWPSPTRSGPSCWLRCGDAAGAADAPGGGAQGTDLGGTLRVRPQQGQKRSQHRFLDRHVQRGAGARSDRHQHQHAHPGRQ